MKTAFKLDAHPRRPHPPLSEPPVAYFDQLPARVMARRPVPRALAGGAAWWALLPGALRTSLASVAVLGTFVASFWLGLGSPAAPAVSASAAAAALDAVPQTELVAYLLRPSARLDANDLAQMVAARPGMAATFLQPSQDELNEALDSQATEDAQYL
ncbi:hypothetical protein ACFQ48_15575 [Hymenobacter caeli]|uniref:Magnesium transporter MgtE intracellular domain-containing protein n=1 Tax=Hymenobacter caeli TaxID=2735894 RepID=A0ABX2FRN0_9BACT|nr:hypothetical protein [Hymenobacter caeli]NRT19488.1 hypothetical protein [Hymenobacter caeli]